MKFSLIFTKKNTKNAFKKKEKIWKINAKLDDGFLESYDTNSPKILRCN